MPQEIYYYTSLYTNNNIFNSYHKKQIDEITDRDSKLVIMYAVLNEIDIKTFSFSQLVFIDGTYYLVNKIEDYDPHVLKSVKLTLLKYSAGATFTPTSTSLVGLGGGYVPNGSDFNFSGNYGVNTGGLNNINYNQNTFVFGENITVSP